MKKIPTTIISGFLGSGKTTFLNAIINDNKNKKFAIIENEFGEIGIDQDLIIKTEDNIFEMSNGCICCSLNDDLYQTLLSLYKRINDFDELLIETTGIADPSSVALPFIDENQYGNVFELKRIVCIADAEFVEERIKESEEALKQIAVADLIVINKIDLVQSEYVKKLEVILKDINPLAKIITADKNNKPIDEIFSYEREKDIDILKGKIDENHKLDKNSIGSKILTLEKSNIYRQEQSENHDHSNIRSDKYEHDSHKEDEHHSHTHKHSDIESYAYVAYDPIDVELLAMRLLAIVSFNSKAFYRIKGILYATTNEKKLILQSAGGSLVLEEGPAWQNEEEKISKIIFIGKKLHKEKFKSFLDSCLVKN